MRPLHVLLLNQYFPPDTAATASNAALVAKALAERHHVTVLAGRPSYEPLKRHPPYLVRREQDGNLAVERVGSTAFSRLQMKGRLANYVSYLALSVPRALSTDPDVVLAMTDPPIEGIVGASVAQFLGRPFVYNIRDLYPDMALAAGILRPGFWTDIWEQSHRRALRRAARVIVLGEDMRERIAEKGVEPARTTVVRDAVPFPQVLPPPDDSVMREIRAGFRFVIVHAGNLGFSGAWQTLIHAAQMLEAENVGLVFVGEGARKQELQRLAQNCRNVVFLPFRPASEIPAVMAAGDLHVVTIKRGLEGIVVPSKLYNILAHGRPILALATERAEVTRLVQRHECGVAADPDNPTQVAEEVRRLLHAPERLERMSLQARNLARSYDRLAELRKFVDAVEQAAER
jgi:putative colanic acid biosynthesis glycosyltransferase WcaI